MPVNNSENDHTGHSLDQLNQALSSGMFVHVRNMLQKMAASDIALILESSPPSARQVLWQLIDQEQIGDILDELSEELKDPLIRSMSPERVAKATASMDTDDLAYILRSLPDAVYKQVLQSMTEQNRRSEEHTSELQSR